MIWKKNRLNFESAVRPELPVIYRVCRRLGTSTEDAEDMVQQTLIKAYENWDKFDGKYLRSWLIKILRNEVFMLHRINRRLVEMEAIPEDLLVEEPFWNQVLWNSDAESLLKAMDSLPDIHKILITLCDVESMTYEEAAESLDIPVGTVRSRLFRARESLRNMVGHTLNQVSVVER